MAISNKASLTSKITSEAGDEFEVTTQSNTLILYDLNKDISIVKTASKAWTIPNSRILMTTTITNNTGVQIENVTLNDTLTAGATFVEGTLKVGDQEYPDDNPMTGATLPVTIGALGGEMSFSYEVLVDTAPQVQTFSNTSNITITLDGENYDLSSNEMVVHILDNEVFLLKSADKTFVKSGDEVTFTTKISNTGTLTNTNVMFFDPIPEGATFVAGSVKIDGTENPSADPESGISLKDLSAGAEMTIEFKVTID